MRSCNLYLAFFFRTEVHKFIIRLSLHYSGSIIIYFGHEFTVIHWRHIVLVYEHAQARMTHWRAGMAMFVARSWLNNPPNSLQQSKSLDPWPWTLSRHMCEGDKRGSRESLLAGGRGGIVLNRILGRRQLLHSYQSASALRPTGFLSSAPVDWAELIMKMHFWSTMQWMHAWRVLHSES